MEGQGDHENTDTTILTTNFPWRVSFTESISSSRTMFKETQIFAQQCGTGSMKMAGAKPWFPSLSWALFLIWKKAFTTKTTDHNYYMCQASNFKLITFLALQHTFCLLQTKMQLKILHKTY